jgi:hypothetical protein
VTVAASMIAMRIELRFTNASSGEYTGLSEVWI